MWTFIRFQLIYSTKLRGSKTELADKLTKSCDRVLPFSPVTEKLGKQFAPRGGYTPVVDRWLIAGPYLSVCGFGTLLKDILARLGRCSGAFQH